MKSVTKTPKDIDEYIAGFPPAVRTRLKQIRAIVRKAAPDAEEAIKYQMPTFVRGKNLVHFAAFRNHVGLYPTPSGIAAFKKDLAPYVNAKGSVQFPHDKPLPLKLIERMVKYRANEAKEKPTLRKKA